MNRIEFGDCRDIMRRWAADGVRVQTCVTSPPYFGLRDYGVDGQLGLEDTPEQFIANMVEVFRCVRDVLADDGTLWVNIGDTYTRDPKKGDRSKYLGLHKNIADSGCHTASQHRRMGDTKPKDLIGVPWMLAFALRADGWYLRQDIIWHKPNPMPESVRDRCTKAHEYIFLLSKSERYYYDAEAMNEPANPKNYRARARVRDTPPGQTPQGKLDARRSEVLCETRNRRSVWTVATRPYSGAHFATFPPALIEPCILAGSRPGDIVLDPFMGSGTTAATAAHHGRRYLGCELNADYRALQDERIADATRQPDMFRNAEAVTV